MSGTLTCPHCEKPLAPTADRCPACGKPLEPQLGSTRSHTSEEESIPAAVPFRASPPLPPLSARPNPEALPPWRNRLRIALAAILLFFGFGLNSPLYQGTQGPDLLQRFKAAAVQALRGGQRPFWRMTPSETWLEQPLRPVIVASDARAHAVAESVLRDLGIDVRKAVDWQSEEWERHCKEPSDSTKKSESRCLVVEVIDGWLYVRLSLILYSRADGTAFAFEGFGGPLSVHPWLTQLGLVLLLIGVIWFASVAIYRRRQRAAYQIELAFHMAAVEEHFRNRIGIPTAQELPDQSAAVVFLRVLGSPFAYRAVPGASRITIGRQRHKPGLAPDQGNDIVIRVPGSDALSLRISRRHLEIERLGDRYYVRDCSKGGTRMNGEKLPEDRRAPIRSGDHLILAKTLTLEFLIRSDPTVGSQLGERIIASAQKGGLELEATFGDLVTTEPLGDR